MTSPEQMEATISAIIDSMRLTEIGTTAKQREAQQRAVYIWDDPTWESE